MDKIVQPSKTARAGRFFDDGDFTADHDAINAWVMLGGWKKIAAAIYPEYTDFLGEYRGEPPLEGYPTVYPDGLVTFIKALVDHRQDDLVVTKPFRLDDSSPTGCARTKCPHCARIGYLTEEQTSEWELGRTGFRWNSPCKVQLAPLCIEIKGAIPTFGDVLRQMNIYRARLASTGTLMVLVTPERQHDAVFVNQKVFVIHPADLGYEE